MGKSRALSRADYPGFPGWVLNAITHVLRKARPEGGAVGAEIGRRWPWAWTHAVTSHRVWERFPPGASGAARVEAGAVAGAAGEAGVAGEAEAAEAVAAGRAEWARSCSGGGPWPEAPHPGGPWRPRSQLRGSHSPLRSRPNRRCLSHLKRSHCTSHDQLSPQPRSGVPSHSANPTPSAPSVQAPPSP